MAKPNFIVSLSPPGPQQRRTNAGSSNSVSNQNNQNSNGEPPTNKQVKLKLEDGSDLAQATPSSSANGSGLQRGPQTQKVGNLPPPPPVPNGPRPSPQRGDQGKPPLPLPPHPARRPPPPPPHRPRPVSTFITSYNITLTTSGTSFYII